ncbi:Yos1-like [Trypanosoma melophagium]|uniref:Yos1-like n=1 Tax=Trypanosoma melophagium TaxID=715481 RepID=UPI003519E28B|nr:Yos1-like [Trypanosoma melophagium]
MGFSVGSIAQALLLCLNAMAILSERRFLSKYGLATGDMADHGGNSGDVGFTPTAFGTGEEFGRVRQTSAFKAQLAKILSSVRTLLRWPLILINIGVIIFTLVFG